MSFTTAARPLAVALEPGGPPLLHVDRATDATAWTQEHREALRATVQAHGAVLVRGLGIGDAATAGDVFRVLSTDLVGDREAFAARKEYAAQVYSSSAWPPGQPMCMHHELSYTLQPPGLLLFACLTPPTDGGVTALADSHTVLRTLPGDLVDRFERHGWMLLRNYNQDIGASVADSLGTDDPAAVEAYCRDNAIDFDWQPDGGLQTRQRRAAVVEHPETGDRCWFNQVAFLSEWTLDPEVREFLVEAYGADALPFTTRLGDGELIAAEVVDLLNDVYEQHTLREPWQAGDLMLVDNVRMAHSREAFTGPREIVVGMADPVHLIDGTHAGKAGAR